MKRKILTIIIIALFSAVTLCSCEKEPKKNDPQEEEQSLNEEDSSAAYPDIIQPWVDNGVFVIQI